MSPKNNVVPSIIFKTYTNDAAEFVTSYSQSRFCSGCVILMPRVLSSSASNQVLPLSLIDCRIIIMNDMSDC